MIIEYFLAAIILNTGTPVMERSNYSGIEALTDEGTGVVLIHMDRKTPSRLICQCQSSDSEILCKTALMDERTIRVETCLDQVRLPLHSAMCGARVDSDFQITCATTEIGDLE